MFIYLLTRDGIAFMKKLSGRILKWKGKIIFALIVKRLPSSRFWNRFVLKDQSTASRGYVSAVQDDGLIGKHGIVLTELRPSGSVRIDGHPVDVVSEGAFIRKGEEVEVISVHGSRVLVRRVDHAGK